MKLLKTTGIMMIIGLSLSCSRKVEPPAIDPSNMDMSVKPGDDFYQYANGGWMKNNPLPPEFSRFGIFDKLAEDNNVILRKLVEELSVEKSKTGTVSQQIGDFFASGIDSASIQAAGIKPLEKELNKIKLLKTSTDIQNQIAYLHTLGINPLFDLYGQPDAKNSALVIAHLTQGGLSMTDKDYYLATDQRVKDIRSEFMKYMTKVFQFAGETESDAAKKADVVMQIETRLAKASMDRVELRDPYKTYHKMSLEELQKVSSNIDWKAYFKNIGISNPGDLNVMQPDFFAEASKMMKDISVENWKIYLSWHLLNNSADYLSNDFVYAKFDFYGKVLSGSEQIKPRWKRVLRSTNEALGEAIGQIYVKKYFPPEAKERMLTLVNNLKWALEQRIQKLQWMEASTKQKALEKLKAINVKIGYPDEWRDYSSLKVTKNAYLENALTANTFNFKYMVNRINKPVNKKEWDMTPQTVNAYYNPNMNEICFPAGILQPPFFFLHADDAVNYGAIGVVIGHEISHGFDDEGRQYDKIGNLTDWWTKADAEKFKSKTDMLVNQFDSFVVLDTVHANGHLTLGENIADFAGLNISFTALQKALEGKDKVKIDNFTPEQRFYLAFAHVWVQNIRDKEILRRTKEDVHSLGKFRVNGPLPNLPEFYKAFAIKEGDKIFLPENKRAIIW